MSTADTFTRSNSSTSLGTADTGETWTALSGTWGISSNKGYLASATSQATAVLDPGVADGIFQCDVTLSSTNDRADGGVIVRAVDANNYLLVTVTKVSGTNAVRVFSRVAGSFTLLATLLSGTLVNGNTYTVKVAMFGDNIDLYVNGVLLWSTTSAIAGLANTNTKVGLREDQVGSGDDGGTRFDNLLFLPGSLSPGGGTGTGCVTDTFTRNDAATLGNAESGHGWTPYGALYGIDTGKAYQASGGVNGQVVADLGIRNVDATVDMTLGASYAEGGLVLCFVDTNNYLAATIDRDSVGNDRVVLEKVDTGSLTALASYSSAGLSLGSTHTLRCQVCAATIKVWLDGTLIITYTPTSSETSHFNGTLHGFSQHRSSAYPQPDDGTSRFDNFQACSAQCPGWVIGELRF